VPAGDHRFDSTTVRAFVRVAVRPAGERYAGRSRGGTYRTTRARTLVVCECYARGSGEQDVATVDAVSEVSERVAHRLRLADLQLRDFVADPSGETLVDGAAIRFADGPTFTDPGPDAGWDRRIVTAEATHFIKHSET
jgi:hypothetical protein